MAISVYNTLDRKKVPFIPVTEGRVGIYLCGPTVYKPSHIGHAVGPVIFDAIRRWLEFRGYDVTMVVNITDVDDKIIEEANRQGWTMNDLAEEVADDYRRAMKKLNVLAPSVMPKATEHIPEIIELVTRLIDKGAAYVVGGDVYFDVSAFPPYGRLSNRTVDDQESGTRALQSATEKRHPWDFALWKAAKPGEPAWDSPWGKGRPGWHIECSAMSMKYLGETFDIHGGGMDLIFPHHENEIAQSEAATGKPFVKYWLHNGLTRVNTKKMSKSLGNIRILSDLLEQFSGETIRFFILSTHYTRPIDFSDEEIVKVQKGLQTFYRLFDRVKKAIGIDIYVSSDFKKEFDRAEKDLQQLMLDKSENKEWFKHAEMVWSTSLHFCEVMDDDFNTAQATGGLYILANSCNSLLDIYDLSNGDEEIKKLISASIYILMGRARLLGLFENPPETKLTDQLTDDLMKLLIEIRNEARNLKQFALSDMVRDRLKALHIQLKDGKDGTTWEKIP